MNNEEELGSRSDRNQELYTQTMNGDKTFSQEQINAVNNNYLKSLPKNRPMQVLWILTHDPRKIKLRRLYHMDELPTDHERSFYEATIEEISPSRQFMKIWKDKNTPLFTKFFKSISKFISLSVPLLQERFSALGMSIDEYAKGNSMHLHLMPDELMKECQKRMDYYAREQKRIEAVEKIKDLNSEEGKAKFKDIAYKAEKDRDRLFREGKAASITSEPARGYINIWATEQFDNMEKKMNLKEKVYGMKDEFLRTAIMQHQNYANLQAKAAELSKQADSISIDKLVDETIKLNSEYRELTEDSVDGDILPEGQVSEYSIDKTNELKEDIYNNEQNLADKDKLTKEEDDGAVKTADIDNSEYKNDMDELEM